MTAVPDFAPRGAGAPVALLELDRAERAADHSNRASAIDALVDDAWQRVSPDDPRWEAISLLLITKDHEPEVFRAANAFAQRLIKVVSDVQVEHLDLEGGVTWRRIRQLEALQGELAEVVGALKAELAEVQS